MNVCVYITASPFTLYVNAASTGFWIGFQVVEVPSSFQVEFQIQGAFLTLGVPMTYLTGISVFPYFKAHMERTINPAIAGSIQIYILYETNLYCNNFASLKVQL